MSQTLSGHQLHLNRTKLLHGSTRIECPVDIFVASGTFKRASVWPTNIISCCYSLYALKLSPEIWLADETDLCTFRTLFCFIRIWGWLVIPQPRLFLKPKMIEFQEEVSIDWLHFALISNSLCVLWIFSVWWSHRSRKKLRWVFNETDPWIDSFDCSSLKNLYFSRC